MFCVCLTIIQLVHPCHVMWQTKLIITFCSLFLTMTSLADRLVSAEDSRFCSVSHLPNWLRRLASMVFTRTLHSAAKCCCSSDSLEHHWSDDMNIKGSLQNRGVKQGTLEKIYTEHSYKNRHLEKEGQGMEYIINKERYLCKSKLSALKTKNSP